tara:strand:+ start:1121 stop:1717 length:597 start_codon:yes stop_codon:yes gene_type:complete
MLNLIRNLFKVLFLLHQRVESAISTLVGKFMLWVMKVDYGKNLKFFGLIHVRCSKQSTVTIGSGNTFRSKSTSNLIGIDRPCIISSHQNGTLKIGDNCGFSGTVIGCFKEIIIEDNVRCGANTLITDSDWHSDDHRSGTPRPIHIETNVWLGVNVTVLKGVHIGANSVIGAGSIVTQNIPANVIAAGNPCRIIKSIDL